MRKITVPFKRDDRKGWWVRWYENGKPKHKCLDTKQQAEHFRNLKYMEINSDVFQAIPITWLDLEEKYLQWYRISGKKVKEVQWFLNLFHRICPISKSTDINQMVVNHFIEVRQQEVDSDYTIYGNVSKLKTLCNWLTQNNYAIGKVNFPVIKRKPPRKGAILSESDLYDHFMKCRDKNEQLNYMLSICTGLRKEDVGRIDYITNDISEQYAEKTGKVIDAPVCPVLVEHGEGHKLARLSRKAWERIMSPFTHHDLRRTQAQLINDAQNLDIASELLQHSSTRVTKDFYLKAGKRAAVNAVFEPMFKAWLTNSPH